MDTINLASVEHLKDQLDDLLNDTTEAIFFYDHHYYRIHSIQTDVIYLKETNCSGISLDMEDLYPVDIETFKKDAQLVALMNAEE